ncbi:MAG: hypothetical protein HC902_02210 [Calothrix sp. SM1_5_4]|nr:hypothetical protein [Calothrix sp. SM1_5_4]
MNVADLDLARGVVTSDEVTDEVRRLERDALRQRTKKSPTARSSAGDAFLNRTRSATSSPGAGSLFFMGPLSIQHILVRDGVK